MNGWITRALARVWAWILAADRHRLAPLLVMALAATAIDHSRLSQDPQVELTRQVKRLNPDAKLYWGLAKNLVAGEGFYDTVRNKEILPSIGHPQLMALGWEGLGLSPAQYTKLVLWFATLLTTWAVLRYTRSALLGLLSLGLQLEVLRHTEWLVGNVECSIALANAVLLTALAELYRADHWRPWGVLTGLALAAQLLVRPVLLYPLHLVAVLFAVALLVPWMRQRILGARKASTWIALGVMLLVAETALGLVRVESAIVYDDSRLVTGTYGAWTLYSANHIDVPPNEVYRHPIRSKRWVERCKLVGSRYGPPAIPMGWEEREKLLLAETAQYVKGHPGRALHGYFWRLSRFLGLHGESWDTPWGRYHTALTLLLLGLLIANLLRPASRFGMGVLCAALVLSYAAIHALFVWVGIRYASPVFSMMTVGVVLALSDLLRGRLANELGAADARSPCSHAPRGEAPAS